MRAPFGRIGGKSFLKKQILKMFPKNIKIYVEPFVGAGSLLYEKEPSAFEIINDKDKNVTDIHKLFKKYNGVDITEAINNKYSKKEFFKIKESLPKSWEQNAIKNLILSKISFRANMISINHRSIIKSNYDNDYKDRLKLVTIFNKDYKQIILKYDSADTFFYLDPPYEDSDKGDYIYNQVDPNELFENLKNIKGKFLLSYNDSLNIKNILKQFTIKILNVIYATSTG